MQRSQQTARLSLKWLANPLAPWFGTPFPLAATHYSLSHKNAPTQIVSQRERDQANGRLYKAFDPLQLCRPLELNEVKTPSWLLQAPSPRGRTSLGKLWFSSTWGGFSMPLMGPVISSYTTWDGAVWSGCMRSRVPAHKAIMEVCYFYMAVPNLWLKWNPGKWSFSVSPECSTVTQSPLLGDLAREHGPLVGDWFVTGVHYPCSYIASSFLEKKKWLIFKTRSRSAGKSSFPVTYHLLLSFHFNQ